VEVPTAEPVASLDLPPSVEQALELDLPLPAPPPVQPPVPQFSLYPQAAGRAEERQTIHLKMFRRYPARCLVYLLLVVAPISGGIWLILRGWPISGAACVTLAGFVLCRLVVWWLRMRRTTVTVTNQSCVLESGIFSRQAMAIDLPAVTDIQVKQSLLNRLLNVGDLVASHDNGEMQQVVLMAVPAPKKIADRLHQGQLSADDGLHIGIAAGRQHV
jgi:hypothetical protein